MKNRRAFLKQASLLACTPGLSLAAPQSALITLENAEFRLAISSSGNAHSLLHKPTGRGCLPPAPIPMFSVTQYRPYDNELQLSFPAKPKTFPAESVRREGNRLVVAFALVGYEAVIQLRITDAYLAFPPEKLQYKGCANLRTKRVTAIDEAVLLQIPVLNRKNFGEWLNVV